MSWRASFGPPRNPLGAFGWAVLQLPRALLWTVREQELRRHLVLPWVVTLAITLGLCGLSLSLVGPIERALVDAPSGVTETLAFVGLGAAITAVLVVGSVLIGWQLAGPIAASSFERMALFVQKAVTGTSPEPSLTSSAVVVRAVRGVFPSVRRLIVWVLTSLAALTLVLVPVVGPLLVVVAQTLVSAFFLAHGAIADNRDRLGLPRRLLLREPALLSGYALACVPFVLVPPALLFFGGPVAVGGALVALGAHGRRAGAA